MAKPISSNSPYSPDFPASTPPVRSGVYIRQPTTSWGPNEAFSYYSTTLGKWFRVGKTPIDAYNNFKGNYMSSYQHNGTWRGLKLEDYRILDDVVNHKMPVQHPLLQLIYKLPKNS